VASLVTLRSLTVWERALKLSTELSCVRADLGVGICPSFAEFLANASALFQRPAFHLANVPGVFLIIEYTYNGP